MVVVLLRIGEFARLVQLPVRTVRYYGDIGLLAPSEIDPVTGYRQYGLDKLEQARRLIALRDLGLGLDEISQVLGDELSSEQFRSLLDSHIDRLRTELDRVAEQLKRAIAQRDLLIQRLESPMPDITVKTTEPTTIAFVREQIGGVEEISTLFGRLFASVEAAAAIGPAGNIYHHFSDDGTNIDIEAVVQMPDDYEAAGDAETRRIGAVQVATLMHHGSFSRLHEAHNALLEWVERNDYQVAGPAYEWNIKCSVPATQDDESYITEVCVEIVGNGDR